MGRATHPRLIYPNGFGSAGDSGTEPSMGSTARVEAEATVAVKELRLFISLYENVTLHPESRRARQLEAARRAVAAYEAVERELAAHAA